MRIDRPAPMRTAFMKFSFRFPITPLRLVCLTLALIAMGLRAAGSPTEIQLWPVDALVKVFPDDLAPAHAGAPPTRLEVAAGETEPPVRAAGEWGADERERNPRPIRCDQGQGTP